MASKDEREFDSGLTGGTDVPALEEDFSLEEILAEYGAGREQRLMEAVEQEARRETEPAAPPAEGGAKKPPLQTEARPRPAPQVTEKTAPPQKPPAQPEDLLEELRQDRVTKKLPNMSTKTANVFYPMPKPVISVL